MKTPLFDMYRVQLFDAHNAHTPFDLDLNVLEIDMMPKIQNITA